MELSSSVARAKPPFQRKSLGNILKLRLYSVKAREKVYINRERRSAPPNYSAWRGFCWLCLYHQNFQQQMQNAIEPSQSPYTPRVLKRYLFIPDLGPVLAVQEPTKLGPFKKRVGYSSLVTLPGGSVITRLMDMNVPDTLNLILKPYTL